jgi:hypothetical protein
MGGVIYNLLCFSVTHFSIFNAIMQGLNKKSFTQNCFDFLRNCDRVISMKWIRNKQPVKFISEEELKMARYAELRDEKDWHDYMDMFEADNSNLIEIKDEKE